MFEGEAEGEVQRSKDKEKEMSLCLNDFSHSCSSKLKRKLGRS